MHQLGEPADLREADDGHQNAAGQQDRDLHKVRPCRGFQAAIDRVGSSEDTEKDDSPQQVNAEHALQGQAARVEGSGDEGEEIANHAEDGEQVASDGVVAALQEFGHGVQPGAHVIGQKNPDEQGVNDPGVPAEGGDHDAMGITGAHLRDEMVAADGGRDHGSAHDIPGQFVRAHKIIAWVGAAFAGDEEPHRDREQQIGGEDRPLIGCQLYVSYRHSASILRTWGPSHRQRRQACANSFQSCFQSPGMRANRLA